MKNIIKIGIIQQSNSASIETNRANLIHKIKQLANDGAELIVLQELHDSLYFCQSENISCFEGQYNRRIMYGNQSFPRKCIAGV